uniref:OTU protein n=1 Tax=Bombyx mori TaxID=7091 RepID=E9NX79_BOMMO|nr:OTU protein [Bombyx mori]
MSNPSESGGLIEISAMSHLYRRDFVIFEANKGPQIKITNGYNKTIYLYYSTEMKHFDAIYTKDFINNSSFCQCAILKPKSAVRPTARSAARHSHTPRCPSRTPPRLSTRCTTTPSNMIPP